MTIGAIGGCSDCGSNLLRPDKVERPGQEGMNPIEEANRLAQKNGEVAAGAAGDQRVNPTANAARSGSTQTLTQAAQVNELRDGDNDAAEGAHDTDDGAKRGGRVDRPPADQTNQAAEAGDPRYPNRGGILDFHI
jgi:predicted  nucleic acid-binding Zn-ribbon protein